jgi:hypothetical protein
MVRQADSMGIVAFAGDRLRQARRADINRVGLRRKSARDQPRHLRVSSTQPRSTAQPARRLGAQQEKLFRASAGDEIAGVAMLHANAGYKHPGRKPAGA